MQASQTWMSNEVFALEPVELVTPAVIVRELFFKGSPGGNANSVLVVYPYHKMVVRPSAKRSINSYSRGVFGSSQWLQSRVKFVSTATPDDGLALHMIVSVTINAPVVTLIGVLCTPLPFTVNPDRKTW